MHNGCVHTNRDKTGQAEVRLVNLIRIKMVDINVDDILHSDDLRHEAGLYTVAATTARAMELFHEYQNAVPDNPMKFDRINRATLRGKIRGSSSRG